MRALNTLAVISTWVTANPSTHVESNKIIVHSNVLAVKNGLVMNMNSLMVVKESSSP